MLPLLRSETSKLVTERSTRILVPVLLVASLGMAWTNAAPAAEQDPDSDLLFSAVPVPLDFQGFEMAGFGQLLIVAIAALWAGSEHGSGGQLRTTLLATPRRLRVFLGKAALIALSTAVLAFVSMTGTIIITHAAGDSPLNPWTLTPGIWRNLAGLTLSWTLTALITFAVGTLARTAIVPLILLLPFVIGVGEFLAVVWPGARYLPLHAGNALYADPAPGAHLDPTAGALVQATWTIVLLTAAALTLTRRDV